MGKVANFFSSQGISLALEPKRQMIALDKEFSELEAEAKSLKAQLLDFEAQVNPLKREVERLKKQIEQKTAPDHDLDQSEIEILKFIGDKKSATSSDIEKGMKLHSVTVEHFLGRLLKAKYLVQEHVPMIGAMYSLSDKGNTYLVEKKLVPLTGRQAEQPSNPDGYHCDHCGSQQLKRIGNRPDPMFAEVGIKQAVFSCLSCGKESAFTQEPR